MSLSALLLVAFIAAVAQITARLSPRINELTTSTSSSILNAFIVGAYGEFNAGSTIFDGVVSVGASVSAACQSFTQNEAALSIKNGYVLTAAMVNSHLGGIRLGGKKYELRITMLEDSCDSSLVVSTTNTLVGMNIELFLGPVGNELTETAISSLNYTISQGGNPNLMIAPDADRSSLFGASGTFTFGILPEPSMYERAAFSFVTSLAKPDERIVLAILDDGTSQFCSNNTAQHLAAQNSDVIRLQGYYNVSSQELLEAALLNAKIGEADVLFGCTTFQLCVDTARATRAINFSPAAMLFTDCITYSSLYEQLGEDAQYLLGLVPWSPDDDSGYSSVYTNLTALQFKQLYLNYYGSVPSFHAVSAFSATELIGMAIEAAGNTSTVSISEQLQVKSSYFQTLIGNISYSLNGSTARQPKLPLIIAQVDTSFSSKPVQNVVYRYHESSPSSSSSSMPTGVLVYPMPSFAEQSCLKTTNNCSGHGNCDNFGSCQCTYRYYGVACDQYCTGTFDATAINHCIPDREFLVAGFVPSVSSTAAEFSSITRFIVELINNASSSVTSGIVNVKIKLHLTYGDCNADAGFTSVDESLSWAESQSQELSG
jgi:ABC-type branched-subunit amino acid transport system substrate-binding protein